MSKNTKIKNIKVNNIDDTTNSRAISIKISKFRIETPNRSITSNELNKFKGLRNELKVPVSPFEAASEIFPWKIYESQFKFNKKIIHNMKSGVNGLSSKKSQVKSKINTINSLVDNKDSPVLKIMYPQTIMGEDLSNNDLQLLMDIQRDSNLDIITIPEPTSGCSFEEFKDNLKYNIDFLDDFSNDKPIMPLINIKSNVERFSKKLDYVQGSGFGMVGIVCRVYSHANLHYIRNNVDKYENFWFHGFDAYRNKNNSVMYNPHAAQLWGIDTVGLALRLGRPNNENISNVQSAQNINNKSSSDSSIINNKLNMLRVYDGNDWAIYKVDNSSVSDVLCDCDACKYISKSGEFSQNALDVHEAFASQKQNIIARKRIIEGDYKNFVLEKKQLKNYYEGEVGDLNQSSLNNFF